MTQQQRDRKTFLSELNSQFVNLREEQQIETIFTEGAINAVAAEPPQLEHVADPLFQKRLLELKEQEMQLKDLELQLNILKQLKNEMISNQNLAEAKKTEDSLKDAELQNVQEEQTELFECLNKMSRELDNLEKKQKNLKVSFKETDDLCPDVESDDEGVEIENLIGRLDSASVEHKKPESDSANDANNLEQEDLNETETKIDAAIDQLGTQIQQIRMIQNTVTSEDDSFYCQNVLDTFEKQMGELIAAKEKITAYKDLLLEYQSFKDKEVLEVEENDAVEEIQNDFTVGIEKPVLEKSSDTNRINNAATTVIKNYENNPAFLLAVFKALKYISTDSVSQQKLLCVLDELVDVRSRFDEDSCRERIHLSTFNFIEGVCKSDKITQENVQSIINHVNSMVYAHLISATSTYSEKGVDPCKAMQIMNENSAILKRLGQVYVGQDSKTCSLFAYDLNRFFDSVFGWNE